MIITLTTILCSFGLGWLLGDWNGSKGQHPDLKILKNGSRWILNGKMVKVYSTTHWSVFYKDTEDNRPDTLPIHEFLEVASPFSW